MKRIIALILSVSMVFAFTACGSSNDEAENEATQATEAAAVEQELTGFVEDLNEYELTVYNEDADEVTFDVEDVTINAEKKVHKGDTATVKYEGEIDNGDATDCDVISVSITPGKVNTLTGKVESIGDGTVTIASKNGKYTFKTKDIKIQNGPLKVGKEIRVKYAGVINGEDTSHVYLKGVKVKEPAPEVKAVNEAVWATGNVNVRTDASASAEKVATVKKGEKLTRTGVLSNGWSRVEYKGKDRYIASDYLTTKNPAKAQTKATEKKETKATKKETKESKATKETKATETKATETKATETKATETKATDPSSDEPSDEPSKETEPSAEPSEETEASDVTEETEPETVTVAGMITDYDKEKDLIKVDLQDKEDEEMIFNIKEAKVDEDIVEDGYAGRDVKVEYIDEDEANLESVDGVKVREAVKVFSVDGAKGVAADANGGGNNTLLITIIALAAIALAAIIVVARNRRKNAA